MPGIVIQLQMDAVNPSISVSNLLQKAFLVAKKLKLSEANTWISQEMNGYQDPNEVPVYRNIRGELHGTDHYDRTAPVVIESEDEKELITTRKEPRSVDEIESILASTQNSTMLQSPIPHEFGIKWMKQFNMSAPPFLVFPKTELQKIVGAVKIKITSWAAELEENGVIGEDYTFTQQEIDSARNVNINIRHMENSQIQYASNNSSQSQNILNNDIQELCDLLKDVLSDTKIESGAKETLSNNVSKIESEMKSGSPNKSILKSSIEAIKRICEGAASSAIGGGIIEKADIIIKALS